MLYFLLYLFLEVMISSSIASSIGGLLTFVEILFSAMIGTIILKNFKYSLSESIQKARSGQITQEEFLKTNVAKAIGAFLLIIPGFFTDIIGILLQLGLFVTLFSKIFAFKKPSNDTTYSRTFEYIQTDDQKNNTRRDDEIIDVEIIDNNSAIK